MISEHSVVSEAISPSDLNTPASRDLSNISSLLEALQCDDEDIIVSTLQELQKVVSECGDADLFNDWCRFLSPLCCGTHSSDLLVSPFHFCSFSLFRLN
ncbi:hypothetical protein BLNAU_12422 [Blattamonas nauphoetae]|uniref:Uncharacterized protein n=1 Tax=Blattamonas nauphoetae TaxID=2049346 RepID=A0ABQ9XLG7_9EUKA|nr:hypothetical protein BLNAU_12422 [Blattamonas nauphoetae]